MTLLLALTTMMLAMVASAAPPVGQTIWIKASATNRFVSADQNRGAFAPLVADRTTVGGWEQFQVIDVGGGFIALKSIGTGKFVSADLNRGTFAPLVSDRTSASTWETFTWAAVGGTPPPPPPPTGAPPGFPTLLWSDEFNGTTINGANWTYDLGNGGFGNNELENYTNRPENARIENGMLVIEARRENLGGSAYSSARLKTQGLRTFGVNTWFEARIQAPQGQGIWPAFWSMGSSISTVGWPSCGEIDIMEMRGQNPTENLGTMHWANDNGSHASFGGSVTSPVSLAAGFHTYAISRTTTAIKWYLDGVQYFEGNIAGGINSTSEFQGQFFILLNVAVGGNFVGSPDASTQFPQQMKVDYVRVWGQ